MRMRTDTVWVDVGTPSKNVWGVPDGACPIPLFSPNFDGPVGSPASSPVLVPHPALAPSMDLNEQRKELHKILNCIQSSTDFGIYICESLRDPRRHYIDDYWAEISDQAFGLDDLHRSLGTGTSPMPEEVRARFHRLARLFERLCKRIDRVVMQAS
jgi:hypothetical protein